MKRRLAIYGGTFNPPHIGHLITVECVREQLRLDGIYFIPSAQPPNKPGTALASADDRLQMTSLAVEGVPELAVSDIEIRRSGVSYTIDTITALGAQFPDASLMLIIGSDNFLEFQTWKSPTEILARVQLVVMHRPGFPVDQTHHEFARLATFVNVPQIGISSSDIRRRIKLGRSIRYLVPREVEAYIREHNLYRA
jgi:nicotinate-nucleotide adenylyltransferase